MTFLEFVKNKQTTSYNEEILNEAFKKDKVGKAHDLMLKLFKKKLDGKTFMMKDPIATTVNKKSAKSYVFLNVIDNQINMMWTLNYLINNKSAEVYSIDFFTPTQANIALFGSNNVKTSLTIWTLGQSVAYFMPIIIHVVANKDFSITGGTGYHISDEVFHFGEEVAKQSENEVEKKSLTKECKIWHYGNVDYKVFENLDEETVKSIKEQLQYLYQGIRLLKQSNMANQKKLYEETGSVDFCRSIVQIPLNKKLNSFYDDLILEVVFYDDVCTPKGNIKTYEKLDSDEDRLEYLLRNTEITNIGLVYERNNRRVAILEVIGELNYNDERVEQAGVTLLGKTYSDFENMTLKDTLQVNNNDLRQWLQSKIDLDKENMEQLAREFIRGDYYSIHKSNSSDDLYIRYVCRSTGRVYYNILKIDNLKISDYFKENDYSSYAKAWWSLTHLGSSIEGKPVPAC